MDPSIVDLQPNRSLADCRARAMACGRALMRMQNVTPALWSLARVGLNGRRSAIPRVRVRRPCRAAWSFGLKGA